MARAISLVEDEHPAVRELLAGLTDRPGAALVVGLTGAPGVGKSTTTNALVRALRAEGRVVGVVTSGSFAPTLEQSVGMAFVPPALAEPGTALEVRIRSNRVAARVVPLPFYKRT